MSSPQRKLEPARVQRFVQKIEAHPEIFDSMERLLQVVENETGEATTADEAEELLVEELRRMGHDALQSWATAKQERIEREYGSRKDFTRREKKTLLAD